MVRTQPAEQIARAVSGDNATVASVIDRLDSYGIDIGTWHISVWGAIVTLLVLVGVLVFARLASNLAARALARISRFDQAQHLLAQKLISLAIWLFAGLVGIDILGIDLTALAVFSGALGLAIGFGLQKTFGNLIAGIILLMDRSIKPGDVISVNDQSGRQTFGQIRKIGIRAVSVTTRDEREYLIPNENLMVNQVENWSYSSRDVRIQVPVSVAYSTELDRAHALMLDAARSCPRVLASPEPTVWLDAFGDNGVAFVIHVWIRDPELGIGNVKSDVLWALWRLFKAEGIEVPFPQRDLRLRDSAELRELLAKRSG